MKVYGRIAAVAGGILLLVFGISQCTLSGAEISARIQTIVTAADPDITDAYVSSASGLSGNSIWIRVYVKPNTESIASIIDTSLKTIVHGSPVRLTSVTIDVSDDPRPTEVNFDIGALDLDEANEQLGFDDYYSNKHFTLSSDDLVERYGEWN